MQSQRRRDRRVVMLAALPVAAAVVLPFRLLSGGDTDPVAPPVPVRPVAATAESDSGGPASQPAGPTDAEWGVPVGYGRSPAGARAAAVGWVSSLGALMRMGPIALSDTLHELMSTRAAAETLPTFKEERQRFIDRFGVDPLLGFWLDVPVTVDLVDYSEGRATVAVWSQLLMGSKLGQVRSVWRTQAVTLVWERADWRVDDVTRQSGPTPLPAEGELPSPGADFTEQMLEWMPAVTAGSAVEGDER